MAINSTQRATSLRPNCLSFPEVLGQSVASIAPTITPAANIALVFASAGNATWLVYLIATIGIIFVRRNMNYFASRSASAGSLYTYVAKGLGPMAGALCGWALTMAYLLQVGAVAAGFVRYSNIVLSEFGIQFPSILLLIVCMGIAWYYAYTDIQLSEIITILLEFVSISVILILAVLVLAKHGFSLDVSQLTLSGATPGGISLGMVAAVLSFVGFEGSMTLGDEAKRPTQTIPRSMVWSTLFSGCFFIFLSYTEVLGFRNYATPLSQSDAPLVVLANYARVDLLGVGLNVGIAFSFLSATIALLNSGARIVFSLARHNLYPSPMGQVHEQNETPYVAVTLSSIFVLLLTASMSLFGINDANIYGYIGTISTYGFLFAYIMICIAAPLYLSRLGEVRQQHWGTAIVAALFLLIPVIGSIYPIPAAPYNVFPYLFLLYLGVGAGLFTMLRQRSPQVMEYLERDFVKAARSRLSD
jgi:amino acid transporter